VPLFLGQAQIISGQAAAPVQRQWRLGWWAGPRTRQDWPLVGNLPGIRNQDLGAFLALDSLHGSWVRFAQQYNAVSAGGLQADASIDEARPHLASDTSLDWNSAQPLEPNAVVTDTTALTRWQNWLVCAGIFLAIGGSLLASLLGPPRAVRVMCTVPADRMAQALTVTVTVAPSTRVLTGPSSAQGAVPGARGRPRARLCRPGRRTRVAAGRRRWRTG
jgi:hypothetical protein